MNNLSPLTVEEAAKILKVSKYTLYELIKRGEIPVKRIGRQIRIDPETLYRTIQEEIPPAQTSQLSHPAESFISSDVMPAEISKPSPLHFVGSHDPVIELLADFLKHSSTPLNFQLSFKGSMDGLLALFRRQAHISGIHLWDAKTGEYNLPFVHYVLPGESVTLINLVQRVQGLIVQPGNPLEIRSLEDLPREKVRFINRQKGSGTRLRFDATLRAARISPAAILGYENEEQTHFGVASCVANDQADVGIGVQSAAHRMGLDFVPLFHERYDLVTLHEITKTEGWETIHSILNSSSFQIAVQRQVGYDTSLTGKVMHETGP